MASQQATVKAQLSSSKDFVDFFAPFLKNLRKEVVKVALLNPKLKLIKDNTISEGTQYQHRPSLGSHDPRHQGISIVHCADA